jgi:hypothetical protein
MFTNIDTSYSSSSKNIYIWFYKILQIIQFIGRGDKWIPDLFPTKGLAKNHILFIYARRLNRIYRLREVF